MLHHESLCPPFQGAVGVGHDFVARHWQCRQVREESRVDKWSKRKALEEGKSKMCQCVHWAIGAHWGEGEQGVPFDWYGVRS